MTSLNSEYYVHWVMGHSSAAAAAAAAGPCL